MTELKTLKDMPKINEFSDSEGNNARMFNYYIPEKELKAEAVKWIKEYIEYADRKTFAWIVHFFNLTEEDLKND